MNTLIAVISHIRYYRRNAKLKWEWTRQVARFMNGRWLERIFERKTREDKKIGKGRHQDTAK